LKTKSVGVFEPAHTGAGKILPFAASYEPAATPPELVPDPDSLAPDAREDDDEESVLHCMIVPDGEDLA